MNLVTIKEFGEIAKVKKAAISRAKKKKDIVYYGDGKTRPIKIDIDDPLNRNYINNQNTSRLSSSLNSNILLPAVLDNNNNKGKGPNKGDGDDSNDDDDDDFTDGLILDQRRYVKGRADKIEKENTKLDIQNKHLDARYLDKETTLNVLIGYIDSFHSTIDRYFGNIVDDIGPSILAKGEVSVGVMQASVDLGHKLVDDAKNDFLNRLVDMLKEIETKK